MIHPKLKHSLGSLGTGDAMRLDEKRRDERDKQSIGYEIILQ